MTFTEILNSLILDNPIGMNSNQILLILIVSAFLIGLFISWLMFWYLCNKLIELEARIKQIEPDPCHNWERREVVPSQRSVKDLKVLLFNNA